MTINDIMKKKNLKLKKEIVEEIKPIIEYDDNSNTAHRKDSDGYEYWIEYDDNSNVTHYKDSNGYEYWIEYDDNNNITYYKDSEGYEYRIEYDDNSNATRILKLEKGKYYLNDKELEEVK